MKKRRNNPLLLLIIGHIYNDMFWLLLPLLLPLLREQFQLSYTQSGLLLTFYTLVISVFSFMSGHWGDLYGTRRILSLGFLLTAISYTCFVFSKSLPWMLVIIGVAGVGVSTFHSLAPPLINKYFRHRKGVIFGLFEAAGSGGVVLLMFSFGMFVDIFGWRLICALVAMIGLPLAYAFYKGDSTDFPEPEVPQKMPHPQRDVGIFFLARTLRTLGIVGVVSFIPLFAVDILALNMQKASFLLGTVFLGALFGSLLTGWFSESCHPLSIIVILLLAALPTIWLITLPIPMLVIVLLLMVLGISHIGFFPPQNLWLSAMSRRAIQGKVFGVGMTFDGIAMAIAPGLFGYLADRYTLAISFRWTLLPLGAAAILLLILRFPMTGTNTRLS